MTEVSPEERERLQMLVRDLFGSDSAARALADQQLTQLQGSPQGWIAAASLIAAPTPDPQLADCCVFAGLAMAHALARGSSQTRAPPGFAETIASVVVTAGGPDAPAQGKVERNVAGHVARKVGAVAAALCVGGHLDAAAPGSSPTARAADHPHSAETSAPTFTVSQLMFWLSPCTEAVVSALATVRDELSFLSRTARGGRSDVWDAESRRVTPSARDATAWLVDLVRRCTAGSEAVPSAARLGASALGALADWCEMGSGWRGIVGAGAVVAAVEAEAAMGEPEVTGAVCDLVEAALAASQEEGTAADERRRRAHEQSVRQDIQHQGFQQQQRQQQQQDSVQCGLSMALEIVARWSDRLGAWSGGSDDALAEARCSGLVRMMVVAAETCADDIVNAVVMGTAADAAPIANLLELSAAALEHPSVAVVEDSYFVWHSLADAAAGDLRAMDALRSISTRALRTMLARVAAAPRKGAFAVAQRWPGHGRSGDTSGDTSLDLGAGGGGGGGADDDDENGGGDGGDGDGGESGRGAPFREQTFEAMTSMANLLGDAYLDLVVEPLVQHAGDLPWSDVEALLCAGAALADKHDASEDQGLPDLLAVLPGLARAHESHWEVLAAAAVVVYRHEEWFAALGEAVADMVGEAEANPGTPLDEDILGGLSIARGAIDLCAALASHPRRRVSSAAAAAFASSLEQCPRFPSPARDPSTPQPCAAIALAHTCAPALHAACADPAEAAFSHRAHRAGLLTAGLVYVASGTRAAELASASASVSERPGSVFAAYVSSVLDISWGAGSARSAVACLAAAMDALTPPTGPEECAEEAAAEVVVRRMGDLEAFAGSITSRLAAGGDAAVAGDIASLCASLRAAFNACGSEHGGAFLERTLAILGGLHAAHPNVPCCEALATAARVHGRRRPVELCAVAVGVVSRSWSAAHAGAAGPTGSQRDPLLEGSLIVLSSLLTHVPAEHVYATPNLVQSAVPALAACFSVRGMLVSRRAFDTTRQLLHGAVDSSSIGASQWAHALASAVVQCLPARHVQVHVLHEVIRLALTGPLADVLGEPFLAALASVPNFGPQLAENVAGFCRAGDVNGLRGTIREACNVLRGEARRG